MAQDHYLLLWKQNGHDQLGFFRWLARGGKPEFAGVTRLNGRVIDFEANTQEVKGSFNSGLTSYYVPTLERLNEVVDQLSKLDQLSLPLAANLRFLKDYLEAKPEEVRAWLFGEIYSIAKLNRI